MLNGRNLVVDTMAEQYDLLRDYIDAEFWDFSEHVPIPNSIYVLGRQQVVENAVKFRSMAEDSQYVMIFGNSAEGSSTLLAQIEVLGITDLVKQKKVLVITGGEMEPEYPCIMQDHFLIRILEYPENIDAMERFPEIYSKQDKPYDFLFLNGRARPHRKYLWERFRIEGLLDRSIWTMLDGRKAGTRLFRLQENGRDIMDTNTPIRTLPREYEVEKFNDSKVDTSYAHQFAKFDLFGQEWGEIYLKLEPYVDTYFSVVTETVIEYPYSFRTEKIAKVLAIGHPWICATSQGFYRDIRNLGFRTFDQLIDESFDSIENNQERMDRIVDIVQDLCRQGPKSFMMSAQEICKYNQQHLVELVPRLKDEFMPRFESFIQTHRP